MRSFLITCIRLLWIPQQNPSKIFKGLLDSTTGRRRNNFRKTIGTRLLYALRAALRAARAGVIIILAGSWPLLSGFFSCYSLKDFFFFSACCSCCVPNSPSLITFCFCFLVVCISHWTQWYDLYKLRIVCDINVLPWFRKKGIYLW